MTLTSVCMQAMHLVHVVDRLAAHLRGPADLGRGVAAAAALHATVAPAAALWGKKVLAAERRKSSSAGAAAPSTPALAGTFRIIVQLLSACIGCCRAGRYDLLGALRCVACWRPHAMAITSPAYRRSLELCATRLGPLP